MTGKELIEQLKTQRPDVAVSVTREEDRYYTWDGDSPDPADAGYRAYDVVVRVITIRDGEIVCGQDVLGGSYYRDDEDVIEEDAHGYLAQMIWSALEDLDAELVRRNQEGAAK